MFHFRPLLPNDWEKLKQLRLSALKENPKAYGISISDELQYDDQYWKDLCSKNLEKHYQIATTPDGNLIGMLGAHQIFGSLMRHQVEIVQAYVLPQYRRQHIMQNLFLSLKNELKKVPHLEQMIVWVTLHETQIASDLFQKLGFTYAGKLRKTVKYQDQYYDCCWLEASL